MKQKPFTHANFIKMFNKLKKLFHVHDYEEKVTNKITYDVKQHGKIIGKRHDTEIHKKCKTCPKEVDAVRIRFEGVDTLTAIALYNSLE